MQLVIEAKQLIREMTNNVESIADLERCTQHRDVLDEKIRSSTNINDLKLTQKIISEELAKISQFAVPRGMALGAAVGGVGGYLANFSLFGVAGASVAGATIGGLAMIKAEDKQLGPGGSINRGGFFLLKILEQSLNQRIQFLHKREEIAAPRDDGSGLRHRR